MLRGSQLLGWRLCSCFLLFLTFAGAVRSQLAFASSPCRVQSTTYRGWQARDLSNGWVHVMIVPQLGGRVMQVQFGGHDYLFVNPAYEGKYISPAEAAKADKWVNYGGDKLWPLPEGRGDAEHWPGPISDQLDDGEYSFHVVSENARCTVRLDGPSDPRTGLQYTREITISASSPEISFHAVMKNASDHPIRWSVQSVTQYKTEDSQDRTRYNHDFWAFAPANPRSAFVDGHYVRNGLADDPSFSVADGLFTLHWLYLENEVWLDSNAGWVAVIDNASNFGMVERFHYAQNAEYPGHASVIFYKNGAAIELDSDGMPQLRSTDHRSTPYYMEAELNSPMVRLQPGETYSFDTSWCPVRAGKDLKVVSPVGVIEVPLNATLETSGLRLQGTFGVFFAGRLSAYIYDAAGKQHVAALGMVDPLRPVQLDQTIPAADAVRVALHLSDEQGADLGVLGEARIVRPRQES